MIVPSRLEDCSVHAFEAGMGNPVGRECDSYVAVRKKGSTSAERTPTGSWAKYMVLVWVLKDHK